jgi:hypothetical protein
MLISYERQFNIISELGGTGTYFASFEAAEAGIDRQVFLKWAKHGAGDRRAYSPVANPRR